MTDQTANSRVFILLGLGVLLLAVLALVTGMRLRGRSDDVMIFSSSGLLVETAVPALRPTPTLDPAVGAHVVPAASDALPISQAQRGTSNLYVEFVVDASANMAGTLDDGVVKQTAAGDLLLQNLAAYPVETNLGLRAYGQSVSAGADLQKSCQDMQLIAPVNSGQLPVISSWLANYPARGQTPLQMALAGALRDFEVNDSQRANHIVLISSAADGCGGDPCQWMELLGERWGNITLHIVAVGVDEAVREQLSCAAAAAEGEFYPVRSSAEFAQALDQIQAHILAEEIVTSFANVTATAQALIAERNATRRSQLSQAINAFVTPEFTPVPPTATVTATTTATATATATATSTETPEATATAGLPTATYTPEPPPPTATEVITNTLVDPDPQEGGCFGINCPDAGAVGPSENGGNGGGPAADPASP